MGRGEERTAGRQSLIAKNIEVEVWRKSESFTVVVRYARRSKDHVNTDHGIK